MPVAQEGKPDQIVQTLKEKYVKTLKAGYAIWPLAHIVNFRYVPTEQRVLYVNAVQVRVWARGYYIG